MCIVPLIVTGESDWEETDEERIHNWMNVSGLAKATKYELIVVASNGKLEQHSEKKEVITKGGGKNIWAVSCKNVSSGICRQWRFRSAIHIHAVWFYS